MDGPERTEYRARSAGRTAAITVALATLALCVACVVYIGWALFNG